jgi:hypothetical protein
MAARFLGVLATACFSAAVAAGCSGGSMAPADSPRLPTGSCTMPPSRYEDLAACRGSSEQIELDIAGSFNGKTTARIAIVSKDRRWILAAMGAHTAEWSIGADSFTLFAYSSANAYHAGGAYDRGRIGAPVLKVVENHLGARSVRVLRQAVVQVAGSPPGEQAPEQQPSRTPAALSPQVPRAERRRQQRQRKRQ